jgi:hypothetical protein
MLMLAGPAMASDRMLAYQLGDVVGSEDACGLSFDAAAVAAFVETTVAADDMAFAGRMDGAARIMRHKIEGFGAAQRAAHCAQIRRVAKTYGFVK